MKFTLPTIRHDRRGFEALVSLYEQTKSCFFETIEINMEKATWFDADMCAAFGAILYRLSDNVNTISLTNFAPKIGEILSKNGFLSHYGRMKLSDDWNTTISYQRFDAKDERYFGEYIESKLMNRREVPNMSKGLQKKFQESLFEIFSNAVLHSQTELGIFSCGQFFPKRNHLDFSIADLGIGMRQNIKNILGLNLLPEKAIEWAITTGNTTKRGQVPGGLGLKLLKDFIDLNGGVIRIVSDAGYWEHASGKTETSQLRHPFPGTIVNIEIKTDDTHSYCLSSETNLEDIF